MIPRVTNRDLSRLFKLTARMLELHDENTFKVKAYYSLSQDVRSLPNNVIQNGTAVELQKYEGIGAASAKKIIQVRDTGTFDEFDNLLELTPPGLIELLKIRGLTPGKISTIWYELGITTPEEVIEACRKGRVEKLRGFGAKTQSKLIELIEFHYESKGKFLYAEAEYEAVQLIDFLKGNEYVKRAEITGDLRRKAPVVDKIQLLICFKGNVPASFRKTLNREMVHADKGSLFTTYMHIPVEIIEVSKPLFFETEWVKTTGSEEHLSLIGVNETDLASTEAEIYQSKGFNFVIPEMREREEEFRLSQQIDFNAIVKEADLRGCLHNHSNWSDGAATIKAMSERCNELGFEYFGICDHSVTANYAGGMPAKKVVQQWKEIDQLNEQLKPFRIFKGIESDILGNGSLDYDLTTLKKFDFVVASVHSTLNMDESAATKRLLKAIENPYTTILGHCSGRLLLVRKGYPLDYKKIIDACAANEVIIEINANPRRLDIDWSHIHYILEKGVMISINPDGHDLSEIENMRFGIYMARKGGVPKESVLNTYSTLEVAEIFQRKKANA